MSEKLYHEPTLYTHLTENELEALQNNYINEKLIQKISQEDIDYFNAIKDKYMEKYDVEIPARKALSDDLRHLIYQFDSLDFLMERLNNLYQGADIQKWDSWLDGKINFEKDFIPYNQSKIRQQLQEELIFEGSSVGTETEIRSGERYYTPLNTYTYKVLLPCALNGITMMTPEEKYWCQRVIMPTIFPELFVSQHSLPTAPKYIEQVPENKKEIVHTPQSQAHQDLYKYLTEHEGR